MMLRFHHCLFRTRLLFNASFRRSAHTEAHTTAPLFPPRSHLPSTHYARNFILGTATIAGATLLTSYYFDSRAAIHEYVIMPVLRGMLDPETGHRVAVWVLGHGLGAKEKDILNEEKDGLLNVEIWGRKISNPIGLAAGFDKNGEAIDGLFDLGFGYVEIGSITPEPQPGNPTPRFFRLPLDRAVINRYGFNSNGHDVVLSNLRSRIRTYILSVAKADSQATTLALSAATGDNGLLDALAPNRSLRSEKFLGVNLGKNKNTPEDEAVRDYVKGVNRFGPLADVLVINVSSPNTPGLRELQKRDILENLLRQVISARNALPIPNLPPIFVKVAPDLDDNELRDIANAVLSTNVDGIIVSNTTVHRPDTLKSDDTIKDEMGGLSGPPLKPFALHALKTLKKFTDGKIVLVGCGGIENGEDAIEFARAGASIVQLYTTFGWDGVGVPRRIKEEVVEILRKQGKSWKDIIGEDVESI